MLMNCPNILHFLSYFYLFLLIEGKDNVIVSTTFGDIIGYREHGPSKYYTFLGIPYADPPIGPNRFKDSTLKKSWFPKVLNASQSGNPCVQTGYKDEVVGSEDCLYLDIYTPNLPKNKTHFYLLKPVMVFLHGGGFTVGAGNWVNPNKFMDYEVIVVTINYRLGIFGFLSLPDKGIYGNQGLKDQALALKWISRQITVFGGDPSRITLFGQSSGAISAHLHTMSPHSLGLFHNAILQSGTALMIQEIITSKITEISSNHYSNNINCKNLANCLIDLTTLEIMEGVLKHGSNYTFQPVIDNESNSSFLSKSPLELIMSCRLPPIPMIIGITKDEGATTLSSIWKYLAMYDDQWTQIGPKLMFGPNVIINEEIITLTNVIKHFYLGVGKNFKQKLKEAIIQLLSDITVVHRTYKTAKYVSQTNKVYFYVLNEKPRNSLLDLPSLNKDGEDFGVANGDDLNFLFDNIYGYY